MPGPCSAPNGQVSLVDRHPQDGKQPITGKTAVKKGKIQHARRRTKPTRIERERMEDDLDYLTGHGE